MTAWLTFDKASVKHALSVLKVPTDFQSLTLVLKPHQTRHLNPKREVVSIAIFSGLLHYLSLATILETVLKSILCATKHR